MMKGDEKSAKKSNKFMQKRVLFQGLALLFLALAYFTQ